MSAPVFWGLALMQKFIVWNKGQQVSVFDIEDEGDEKVKRRAPTKETIRHLFALSGNLCAFPNCNHLLISATGGYLGHICHIEAAEEGGERFNPDMSNEERRAPANLMLMCYDHHVETNNVVEYPVERLRKIKLDHERMFSGVDALILGEMWDWDKTHELIFPINFHRYYQFAQWPMHEYEAMREFEADARQRLKFLAEAPLPVRAYLELVCKRIVLQVERLEDRRYMLNQEGFDIDTLRVVDMQHGSRLSDHRILEFNTLLGTYKLGGVHIGDRRDEHAIYVRTVADDPFFPNIIRFAQLYGTPTEVFFHTLDFSSLQSV